jgi:hypothetical protein
LGLPFSEEILIDKQDIETFISDKEQLESDFGSSNSQTENVALMVEISKKKEEYEKAPHRNPHSSPSLRTNAISRTPRRRRLGSLQRSARPSSN